MSRLIDLRKINIKTPEDALEFLELFVTKAPQIATVLKDQKFKQISLKNRLDHALNNPPQTTASHVVDETASVLDRMSGKHRAPVPTAEQGRLAQLRAVQGSATAPAAPAAPSTATTGPAEDELPPAPVAPGEIGQLNVPTIDPQAPEPTTAPEVDLGEPTGDAADPNVLSDTSEATPTEDITTDGPTASVPEEKSGNEIATEEEAIEAGGSKSEHPSDDDLQSEDATDEGQEISDAEKAALEAPSTVPTEEDKTPIGTKVARKTAKKKKK